MATSGRYDFSINRDQIIRQALLNIGKIGRYDVPDPNIVADMAQLLNLMCLQMMGKVDMAPGFKVWTRKRGHLFLSTTAGRYQVGPNATGWTNDYVYPTLSVGAAANATVLTLSSLTTIIATSKIGIVLDTGALYWTTVSSVNTGLSQVTIPVTGLPSTASVGAQVFSYQTTAQDVLDVESAILRDQDLSDNILTIMKTTQDYDALPSKAQPTFLQDPTSIYFETQLGNSYIYIDAGAAADTTKHIVLTYMEPIQNFFNPTDTPYYPPEYFLKLCWGLSKLAAPQLNRPWTQNMEDVYAMVTHIGGRKDPEMSSLYFQPGVE